MADTNGEASGADLRGPASSPRPKTIAEAAALLAEQCRLLFEPDQVVELRTVDVKRGGGKPHIEAGFFDADHLLEMAKIALQVTKSAKGVYFTLNPLHPDLLARRCNRIDWANLGELAKDRDVLRGRWLLIDADPVGDPLVSSSDQEKAAAPDTVGAVREFLRSRGWPDPILADSGNGCHLLFRVDLPADHGGRVERILKALAARFDSDPVKINQKVFNPSRVCKLPGPLARKGDHTSSRPHRRAKLLEVPGRRTSRPAWASCPWNCWRPWRPRRRPRRRRRPHPGNPPAPPTAHIRRGSSWTDG